MLAKSVLKSGIAALVSLTLAACSNGWDQPLIAKACGTSMDDAKYNSDGHLDTTYLIARFAGWDALSAAQLAYFSQAPDDFPIEYSAPSGTARLFLLQFDRAHLLSSVLHSLHGGGTDDVQARQANLAALLNDQLDDHRGEHNFVDMWKAGFAIHAMGDAYAHVWGINQQRPGQMSYNPVVGHIPDGWVRGNPDVIAGNVDNYERFVRALYDVLATVDANPDGLDAYLNNVRDWSRTGDEAARISALSASTHPARSGDVYNCAAWGQQLAYHGEIRPYLEELAQILE
jgi:hypothetical protein